MVRHLFGQITSTLNCAFRPKMHGVIAEIIWAFASFLLRQSHAQQPDECARVHAIIARGQGGGDDLNVMSTLSDLILQQIPGSTTVGLPYDHENVLSNEAKRLTIHDGAVLMQEFIEEYIESCPEAKLVVVGYSMVCSSFQLRTTEVLDDLQSQWMLKLTRARLS